MRYDVVEVIEHPAFGVHAKPGGLRVEGVLATPYLISEGTRHPVEAYRESEYRPEVYPGGLWRARDDNYDKPGTEYRRVMIEVTEEES